MWSFLGLSFLYYLFIFFLFRIGFLAAFGDGSAESLELLKAFYLGAKFDFKIIVLTILPYLLLAFTPGKFIKEKLKKISYILSSLIFTFFVYVYFTDIGHYAYLKTRLTAPSILDNIANPMIAMEMMWQTYPVVWIVLGFFVLCIVIQCLFSEFILPKLHFAFKNTKFAVLNRVVLFFVVAFLIYGKFSYYPLRWSEAYFSKNQFVSQLTMNPFLSFLETYRHRDLKFNPEILDKHLKNINSFLGVPESKTINFQRVYKNEMTDKPNVIVILMESLAWDKTSLSNNPLDPTPYIKALTEESLYFSQFYTPTEATARGVFATLTSVPDVVNKKSSSRNPRFVDHLTVMDQFKDYERYYFLGGSASWANIRSLISSNIKDVKIFEEGSYDSPRVDVWGISDLSLFLEAHKVFDKTKKPFVSVIQTAGFHRPYTIPEDKRDFEVTTDIPLEKLRKYGFDSIEQYNSMRFQDYALGQFLTELRKSEYGQNTLVAVLGDHGLPSPESLHVSSGYYKHRLVNHKVPFIIYHPSKLVSREDSSTFGSQVDVFPTIADIIDLPFTTKALGRSLIRPRTDYQNKAFLFSWHRNPRLIGMVEEEFYYEDAPDYQKLFRYKSDKPLIDVSAEYPEKFNELKDLTRGLYEASLYLLENNKKPLIKER